MLTWVQWRQNRERLTDLSTTDHALCIADTLSCGSPLWYSCTCVPGSDERNSTHKMSANVVRILDWNSVRVLQNQRKWHLMSWSLPFNGSDELSCNLWLFQEHWTNSERKPFLTSTTTHRSFDANQITINHYFSVLQNQTKYVQSKGILRHKC